MQAVRVLLAFKVAILDRLRANVHFKAYSKQHSLPCDNLACTLWPQLQGTKANSLQWSSLYSDQHCVNTSSHNRQIPTRTGHLTDANFVTRPLYKDCY